MKIGVLTSSRADYGIYLPLLKKIKEDVFFELEIIAFGTHLSKFHGYTLREIQKDNYKVVHTISTILTNDDAQSVSSSYGLTALKFADFWAANSFDLVLCLGDRFEMNAAVQAGIPFGVKLAHFHGGETTLGAIDNVYRHQITLASQFHFTATEKSADKVKQILGQQGGIFNVGSISLANMLEYKPIERAVLNSKFPITQQQYTLVTFHPETVDLTMNEIYAVEMRKALLEISKSIDVIITMPNADTMGSIFRDEILSLKKANPTGVFLVENFGKENYFAAMYYASFLIGNTSSGIVEAASFNKYVINVGDRQKGRDRSANTIDVRFNTDEIVAASKKILNKSFQGANIYYNKAVTSNVISILKKSHEKF